MTYRYMNSHGRIKSGDAHDLLSKRHLARVLASMKIGERRTNALTTAGIKWIERTG